MAKKKKHSKRRRSVGSTLNPNGPVVKLAAIAVGYFMGDTINPFLDTLIPDSLTTATPATATAAAKPATLSADAADQILMAGELGLGALLLFKGIPKVPKVVNVVAGGVLAGAGLQRALISFNIIKPSAVKGYQSVPVIGGYQSTPVLSGVPAQLQGTVAKVPSQLQGYRVNGYSPNGSGMGVLGSLYTTADNGSSIHNGVNSSGYMN